MGKKLTSALKTKDFLTYPLLGRAARADQEGYRPLFLRVKHGKRTIDIELYDHDGVRIKSRQEDFVNGNINGAFLRQF